MRNNGFYPSEQRVAEDANLSFKPNTLFGIRPANRPRHTMSLTSTKVLLVNEFVPVKGKWRVTVIRFHVGVTMEGTLWVSL